MVEHREGHAVKQPHHPRIRELLLQHPDGLSIKRIKQTLNISATKTVENCLNAMPDAYIDHWTGPVRGQWVGVWVCVVVPENCPRPS